MGVGQSHVQGAATAQARIAGRVCAKYACISNINGVWSERVLRTVHRGPECDAPQSRNKAFPHRRKAAGEPACMCELPTIITVMTNDNQPWDPKTP